MDPTVGLPLADCVLTEVINQSKDWAVSHGFCFRTAANPGSSDTVTFAPHTLLPSPIPRDCFERLCDVQEHINLLLYRVSQDYEFIKDTLKSAAVSDDFTSRLLRILELVLDEGIVDAGVLALLRSDYMLDGSTEDNLPKQVEVNTIASSLGCITSHLTPLHRYTLQILGVKNVEKSLPDNPIIENYAGALQRAWEVYRTPQAAIFFVVLDKELNIFDQRLLEFGIKQLNIDIPVRRVTLLELGSVGKLTDDRRLMINGTEAAVVYYRAGYVSCHFTSETEWNAITIAERSRAICCPNVSLHLAGTKKIQQTLSRPGMVERFIADPAIAQAIRATFAGQYSLDIGPEGDEAIAMATATPDKFVMKPNKEGGGNNIYGMDIRQKLLDIQNDDERNAYILMERLMPVAVDGYRVVASETPALRSMVSEFGIFGMLISDGNCVVINQFAGHLVRTKICGMDEGGVTVGPSVLDTPYLT